MSLNRGQDRWQLSRQSQLLMVTILAVGLSEFTFVGYCGDKVSREKLSYRENWLCFFYMRFILYE